MLTEQLAETVYIVEEFYDDGEHKSHSTHIVGVCDSLAAIDELLARSYKDVRRANVEHLAWNVFIDGKESAVTVLALEELLHRAIVTNDNWIPDHRTLEMCAMIADKKINIHGEITSISWNGCAKIIAAEIRTCKDTTA